MPYYECVFIARQDMSAPQAEALADHFAGVIAEQGGSVERREYWGLRSLAFRLRKNRKGHYTHFNVNAPAQAMHELDRQMRLNEDVVRHLTLRVDSLSTEPSPMMQSRSARDDRGGRDDRPHRDDRGRGDRFRGDDRGEGGRRGGENRGQDQRGQDQSVQDQSESRGSGATEETAS